MFTKMAAAVVFSCLAGTWREKAGIPVASKGKLLSYLAPVPLKIEELIRPDNSPERPVIDNPSIQALLPFGTWNSEAHITERWRV
jgi:hypothetical protein